MPVTGKLSRKFYEVLGDEIASELVTWFNDVDASYRSDLRALNELSFARFDAKVGQRFAEQDAKWERRLAELDTKWERRFAEMDAKLEQVVATLRGERRAGFAEQRADLLRWMFVYWGGSVVTTIGLVLLDLGAEGTYVHNFWTPEEIEPGAAYRFSARREGKEPAEAVVEIPRDYEVEVDINQFPTHWPQVIPRGGCGRPVVESWEFRIVGSKAAWPTAGYSPGALGESSLTSNVTNAVGFLGGVLTKVIPYEACEFRSDGTPVPNYCRLRYTTETVTLSGTVREQGCRGAPIGSVTVQLTEMDRAPARIRTVFSTRAGAFRIGALEPGIPHLLQARAPPGFADGEPIDVYGPHTDTLTLIPGQQVEYDIHLERLTP